MENLRGRMFSFPKHRRSAVFFLLATSASLIVSCSRNEAPKQANTKPAVTESAPKPSPQEERLVTINKLEAKAAHGDPDAQLALAKLLLDGIDANPDYAKAKMLLEQASDKGVPEANLGLVLLKHFKALPDDQLPSIEKLREKALATNDPFVTTFLTPSLSEPPKVVFELANNGYPLAMAHALEYFGFCIADISHSKITGAKAMDFCRSIEKDKNAFQNAVGLGNSLIDQKEVDAEKQRYWGGLRRRLNNYRPSNDGPLGAMRFEHVLKRTDPYSAQIASALSNVGKILKDGLGGRSVPSRSAIFLKRAAELGDSDAQTSMGELYLAGRGVQKDYELATRYFSQGAQQADANAARYLGIAFSEGRGVPKDISKAYFWLSIASMGRNSQSLMDFGSGIQSQLGGSAALRDKIGQAMAPDEIAQAQRLVREWRPSYQTGEPPALVSASAVLSGAGEASAKKQPLKKTTTGTAFWVSKAGHGITNHHVVNGCAEVRIQGREGVVSVVTADQVNDLALLRLPGGASASAVIAAEPAKLRQGDDIVVYGFPLNSLLSSGGNLTSGMVSATTGLGNNTNQIQITAPIQPGSSGSPVMNKRAEVVAVVSMKLSDTKMAQATGSVGQNVNFAASGQTLKAFLDANKVEYKSGGLFSLEKNTADIADEAKKWATVVECWK